MIYVHLKDWLHHTDNHCNVQNTNSCRILVVLGDMYLAVSSGLYASESLETAFHKGLHYSTIFNSSCKEVISAV